MAALLLCGQERRRRRRRLVESAPRLLLLPRPPDSMPSSSPSSAPPGSLNSWSVLRLDTILRDKDQETSVEGWMNPRNIVIIDRVFCLSPAQWGPMGTKPLRPTPVSK